MDRSDYRNYRPARVAARPAASPASHEPATTRRRQLARLSKRPGWRMISGVLAVVILIFLAYGYIHTKHQLDQLNNPRVAAQSETQQLVATVGRLVQLPSGETPTIATVNDASKLKNQAFFSSARNGDKVLIYSKSGKAVLYRPSTGRIVEYSTVNLGNSSSAQ